MDDVCLKEFKAQMFKAIPKHLELHYVLLQSDALLGNIKTRIIAIF